MNSAAEIRSERRDDVIAVTEVTTEAAFDALRGEWDALLDQVEVPSPFQSWGWNRAWWMHFGTGRELQILVFREAGQTIGIAPLYRRRYGIGPLALTALVPFGREIHSREKDLTEQIEFLFPSAERLRLLARLASWLEGRPWSAMLLPDLRDTDVLPEWLSQRVVFTGERIPFYYRELSPTWESFVGSLNKSMRDNVKYYPKLMARHGHGFSFEVASTRDQVSAVLPIFFDLHRARAHVKSGPSHRDRFQSPDCRAFLREVAPQLAAQGQARIGLLAVGGEAAAAQMWFEHGNVMFLYYSGSRPEWARYSVAFVATQEALKDAMARGVQRVEFLRGGGQFKERWGGPSRHRTSAVFGRQPGAMRLLARLRARQRGSRRLWRVLP